MKLRLCKKEDIKQIYEFSKKELKKDAWFTADYLSKVFNRNPKTCYVLEDKGKIIGAHFVADEFNGRAWSWFIATHPKYRGRGLGKKLIMEVAKKLSKEGFYKLYSDAELTNTQAINFHLKIGFKIDGIFSDWYGAGHHALILSYKLKK